MRTKKEIEEAIEFWERHMTQFKPESIEAQEAQCRISTLRWVLNE